MLVVMLLVLLFSLLGPYFIRLTTLSNLMAPTFEEFPLLGLQPYTWNTSSVLQKSQSVRTLLLSTMMTAPSEALRQRKCQRRVQYAGNQVLGSARAACLRATAVLCVKSMTGKKAATKPYATR